MEWHDKATNWTIAIGIGILMVVIYFLTPYVVKCP